MFGLIIFLFMSFLFAYLPYKLAERKGFRKGLWGSAAFFLIGAVIFAAVAVPSIANEATRNRLLMIGISCFLLYLLEIVVIGFLKRK